MPDLPPTKAGIDALPLPEKNAVDYRDPKQSGLILRVSPGGTKSWSVRADKGGRGEVGRSKKITIGRYPDLPLSLAREKARKMLSAVADGIDVDGEKKAAAAAKAKRRVETIEAVGRDYIERTATGRHRFNGKPMRPRPRALEKDYLERVVIPKLGKRPLADITRAELQRTVDAIETEFSPGAARHARNVIQKIFAFAVWQEIVANDPTRFVSSPTWTERERVLTDEEMAALWRALSNPGALKGVSLSVAIATAIKLAAVTLQRRGEVSGMRLDEIDRKARTWTMAGERTKNGRTHVVPLSALAIELIDEALAARTKAGTKSQFVFPSPRNPAQPVAPNAITHAWGRFLPLLRMEKDGEEVPVTGITPHDLRRTGSTAITSERIAMPRFVVSQVLNHTSDSGGTAAVTAVYDRNAYLKEKRAALDAWAALLAEIVGLRPPPAP
ncbi:tyrosine-type recombinase/integrase [Antarcticirhabdus aurantiaca]|uniref:tyrosine-type recombinase/integrase n=1 Tax=Antarcticirhabdus aurantiaca TaxID=2606717 RepID=UPI00131A73EE|nr:site-specific integrase [Antarcticirhabdus aurantiaca]